MVKSILHEKSNPIQEIANQALSFRDLYYHLQNETWKDLTRIFAQPKTSIPAGMEVEILTSRPSITSTVNFFGILLFILEKLKREQPFEERRSRFVEE